MMLGAGPPPDRLIRDIYKQNVLFDAAKKRAAKDLADAMITGHSHIVMPGASISQIKAGATFVEGGSFGIDRFTLEHPRCELCYQYLHEHRPRHWWDMHGRHVLLDPRNKLPKWPDCNGRRTETGLSLVDEADAIQKRKMSYDEADFGLAQWSPPQGAGGIIVDVLGGGSKVMKGVYHRDPVTGRLVPGPHPDSRPDDPDFHWDTP
jgi:hypothetical protein